MWPGQLNAVRLVCFYDREFLMSSRALFSALRASALAFTLGLRARIALLKLRAFAGASQDLMSPVGRTAVISHFRQLNLICRLLLA